MSRELNLMMVIQAVDRVTKPARQIGAALGDIVRRARLDRLKANLAAARERVQSLALAARNVGQRFRDFGGEALMKVTAPLAAIGGFAFRAFGQMEQLQTSFRTMLGSGDAAKKMVQGLSEFAARTPFQMEGIGQAARQLLAFGVEGGKVIKKLTMLGDISAGANIPLTEMAAIYGKVKAKGKAMTEELLQLSDRGVPVIDVLAKGLGKSKDEIFELASQGRISFDILTRAMETMTAQGGVFHKQMEEQSKTLFGKLSTLMDNIGLFFTEIGEVMTEMLGIKGGLDGLIVTIQRVTAGFRDFAKANPLLTQVAFVAGVLAAAIGPLVFGLGLAASAAGVFATGFSLLLTPIAAVVAALAGLALVVYNWEAVSTFFIEAMQRASIAIKRAWAPIGKYFSDLWEGVKETFKSFIESVFSIFSGFSLSAIGGQWIDGLLQGMQEKMSELIAWLSSAVTELMDWMPDWVKERIGVDARGFGQMPGAMGNAASAIAPAIGRQNGQPQGRFGGEVKVSFENAPSNMRVKEVKSDNPDFVPSVYAGYAMGGS